MKGGGWGETREVDGGRMETSLLLKWTFLGWFGSALEDRSHVCIPAIKPGAVFPLSHKTLTNAASRSPAVGA